MDSMVLEYASADHAPPPDRTAQRAVDRALSDLRRGEAVVITHDSGTALLALAAEAVTTPALNHIAQLAGAARPWW